MARSLDNPAASLRQPSVPLKALHKVQSGDPVLNRFQDQILSVLNSFMRSVSEQMGVLPSFDSASRPEATASYDGVLIRVKDPGAPEQVQACVSKSNGSFEWVTIGQASS